MSEIQAWHHSGTEKRFFSLSLAILTFQQQHQLLFSQAWVRIKEIGWLAASGRGLLGGGVN